MDIYKISLSGQGKKMLKDLKSLGINDLDALISMRIDGLAAFAGESLISKVPIFSQELRNEHIQVEHPSPKHLDASVFIDSKTHTSYGTRPASRDLGKADILARFLDEDSPGTRSQTSKAVSPWFKPEKAGTSHLGWIEKGVDEFTNNQKHIDQLLNG